jgi:hypothetical protein
MEGLEEYFKNRVVFDILPKFVWRNVMSHQFFHVGRHSIPWGRHALIKREIHHTEEPLVQVPQVSIYLARMNHPHADVHILSILRKEGKIPGRIEVLDVVSRMPFEPLKKLIFGSNRSVVEIRLACLGSFVTNGDKKEGIVYCMRDSGAVDIEHFMARDINTTLPTDWFFPTIDTMSA